MDADNWFLIFFGGLPEISQKYERPLEGPLTGDKRNIKLRKLNSSIMWYFIDSNHFIAISENYASRVENYDIIARQGLKQCEQKTCVVHGAGDQ